jgi:hypothetical protein
MAVSSDPEASYPQPPKDFFTAVPFAAEGDVDVYLTQRYCGPVFASDVPPATASIMAVTQGPVTNRWPCWAPRGPAGAALKTVDVRLRHGVERSGVRVGHCLFGMTALSLKDGPLTT